MGCFMKWNVYDARDFGNAVRERRKELGYTQTEIAQVSGVGTMFVSQLERGKPTIELDKALHVAAMLGLDMRLKTRK